LAALAFVLLARLETRQPSACQMSCWGQQLSVLLGSGSGAFPWMLDQQSGGEIIKIQIQQLRMIDPIQCLVSVEFLFILYNCFLVVTRWNAGWSSTDTLNAATLLL
jgi:hypothetical protein